MTTVAELQPGCTVFGSEGIPVAVVHTSAEFRARACYEIEFSTGERIVADDEQRLLTERRDLPRAAGVPLRRATAELADGVATHGSAAYGVRVAPALQLPRKKLPIDPYLFGVWLGAGLPNQPAIRGAGPELVRRLTDVGVRVFTSGIPGQHWVAVPGSIRRGADLGTRLRELKVLDDKHVPMSYLRASQEQRRELLAGLLDSAAIVSDGGEVVFRAPSAGVAVGVHQLIASLGFRPWYRPGGGVVDIGFVTGAQVFGRALMQAQVQARRRLAAEMRPRRLVTAVYEVPPRAVRQVRVASDDGVLLVGRSFIPVPGVTVEPAEQISSPA